MRIVLDTGMFYRPAAMRAARDGDASVVVPAIVLAERLRQLDRDGRDATPFRGALTATGATIEPFDADTAANLPPGAQDDALWRRHARDALIAAHIGPHDELWTTNPRDFEALGVPAARLRGW